jgi:glycosyltransferase involved in cell wall biosynthesis
MNRNVTGPLVSVVVTVYNKELFVRDTLESLERQTYKPLDIVIVDDGSTDRSTGIIQTSSLAATAQVVRLANGGVSRARNIGYGRCHRDSEYVLFLDADDILEPDAIERMVEHLGREPKAAVCFSPPRLIDGGGQLIGDDPDDARWVPYGPGRRCLHEDELETPLTSIWARFRIMPSTALMRRSSYDRTSGWDENLCRPRRTFQAEDKDMMIQLALVGELRRLPVRVVRYRVLPSPHTDALYEGLWAVNVKWWHAPLSRPARRRVRRAVWFEARVAILDQVGGVLNAVRSRDAGATFRATVAVARSIARLVALPVRQRLATRYASGGPGVETVSTQTGGSHVRSSVGSGQSADQ